MNEQIPLLDLSAHHAPIRQEIDAAIRRVLDRGNFVGGTAVTTFEAAFAEYCGALNAVAVGSGTDAILLTLRACGIGPGDEVITVPNTFVATAEAIALSGATPVFVDVDEHTGEMNPALLEPAITPKTRAILPVHLFGHMADMDAIIEVASKHEILVIEDACQAHGSLYKNRSPGTGTAAACFSFYPSKNLGAFGDGGAVVTSDTDLATRVRAIRDHGQVEKNVHTTLGTTSRLDALQAAVLGVKLRYLHKANAARRVRARVYDRALSSIPQLKTPVEAPYCRSNYHLYVVRSQRRDALANHLRACGIACAIHYPTPIHLQPAFAHLGYRRGAFPVAERLARESLSLPMYPEMRLSDVEIVTGAVSAAHARQSIGLARVA